MSGRERGLLSMIIRKAATERAVPSRMDTRAASATVSHVVLVEDRHVGSQSHEVAW
ncbi:hypothetical protein ACIQWZ_37850 [Streptomyces sp. NPDC098077]|uniref:hypothetical protein n=1 Tax=Streptomyces sp. NPDC098077 TaxID=3366093 RepID=UPI003802264F